MIIGGISFMAKCDSCGGISETMIKLTDSKVKINLCRECKQDLVEFIHKTW